MPSVPFSFKTENKKTMGYIKTYGINGLLEWHGVVHSGGIKMKVDFTNGSVTAYGVAPATFITKHELTQHIIENSEEFKSGRIRLVSKNELPNEVSVIEAETEPVDEAPAAQEEVAESNEAPVENGVQKVSVSDKSEAVEWLKEHYPEKEYNGFKLRGKEAFASACKECNVEFDIQG